MSPRGMPSLLGLLGLLAVAGFQNRDKISQVLQGSQGSKDGTPGGGFLSDLSKMFGGGATGGSSIGAGLNDLLNTFKNSGQKDTADSWINPGVPTQGLTPAQVESAIGRDTLQDLATKTGIAYDELLKRLSVSIPETVDRMTPDGNLPKDDAQARQWLAGTPYRA